MSVYVRSIVAIQRPFSIPVDEHNRTAYSVNFRCYVNRPPAKWEEFFASLTGGLINFSSGLVKIGHTSEIPAPNLGSTTDGPFITLIDTGGMSPEETHNGDITERITIQVLVRSRFHEAARDLSNQIYKTVHGLRGLTVEWP
jgi:hypothetical protein